MAEILIENLEKIYPNGFKALHNFNLKIYDGEFIVLVGPSGCSKSTVLRMIAGLEKITAGTISISGRVVNDVDPKDRKIAMVFQNYALYPHMTVYENMSFALKLAKISKKEISERVNEVAKKLEIEGLLNRKPNDISGGQKQRVAVGRAMMRKPDVFLFDEPLSNLDAKLRVSMRTRIVKLHRELKEDGCNSTMVYVTHDQIEAMTMGDRICVLKDGVIMQLDTPLNIYNYPLNKFVAGFIGSPMMNFQDITIQNESGKLVATFGIYKFTVSEDKAKKILDNISKNEYPKSSFSLCFGIRPDDIEDVTSENNQDDGFDAEITMIEKLGNESFCYFKLNEKTFVSRLKSNSSAQLQIGDFHRFYFRTQRAHFFDINTEENVSL